MSLQLGDTAPDFTAETTEGTINFYEFLGNSWGVLFSHPADYTPVCTTELGKTASLKSEFDKRNVKVIALSVDSVESHKGWIKDINETQNVEVNFPLIGDESREIALAYDMIHPNASLTATVRSLFIIAPDKTIKLIITYPASTGRNFQEILRVIDSLQFTANYRVGFRYQALVWRILPGENFQTIPTSYQWGLNVFPVSSSVFRRERIRGHPSAQAA